MAYLEYFVDQSKKQYELMKEETVIGRGDDADLRLFQDAGISRHHCTIRQENTDTFRLVDETAKNGTFLNGQRIDAAAILSEGDQITIGATRLTFRRPAIGRTNVLISEVEEEMASGKGYHTLLREIVKKK